MRYSEIFKEAKRLHDVGFAIHWLHAHSKRPVESGWTTGPRKTWKELAASYSNDLNIGVRLGEPSKIGQGYLAVVDMDVKSKDPRHQEEALTAVRKILNSARCPVVRSGRGNGSRHYYFLSPSPFKTWNPAQSPEQVKVHMPSKKPSSRELAELTEKEIKAGIRLSVAWEVSLYSEGRQVVLPPSIHPDSGELYRWSRAFKDRSELPLIVPPGRPDPGGASPSGGAPGKLESRESLSMGSGPFEFTAQVVDLDWLPISEEVRSGIKEGTGVTDRSAYLLKASQALLSAGLDRDEVLSVLTDPETFLGACGYEHAKTKSRKVAAKWVDRYTLKKVSAEKSVEGIFTKADQMPKARKLTAEEMAADEAEFKEQRDWRQDLVRSGQRGEGPPQKLVRNVVLVLSNEVADDVLRRNEFAYRDTYSCDTPWGGKKDAVVSDDDVARIKYWLGVHYGFEPNDNVIEDALVELACRNAYDPVKDLLGGLPDWDGVPRLNMWLADHFEAEGHPEYLAQVFRKWMVAMILRVYEPGAKFDWMPIFEGAQGVGKSSFGRLLVGDQYFLDWLPNLNDKDSALSLQGMWGVEMGELSQFRRNELENIKAFITRTVDKLRPPYGRRLIESPRRCVFFGTTNRKTYLTDETGNRRFKPLVVGSLDFKILRRDRLQLFAEAKFLYDQKKETELTLELTGEARIFEKKMHAEKMVEDDSHVMEEEIRNFIKKVVKKEVDFDLIDFEIRELFEGTGPLKNWRSENKTHQFARNALIRMGAVMRKTMGAKRWTYEKGRVS